MPGRVAEAARVAITLLAVAVPLLLLAAGARAEGGATGAPRLSGIIVGPTAKAAILAVSGAPPTIVEEGQAFGGYVVTSVRPAAVALLGPQGPVVLRLSPRRESAGTGCSGAAAERKVKALIQLVQQQILEDPARAEHLLRQLKGADKDRACAAYDALAAPSAR